MLLSACRGDAPRQDSARIASSTPASVAAAQPGDSAAKPACPGTGAWARCSIIERLDRAGLAPRVDSSAAPTEPPLTATGQLVRLGNAELELYLYADEGARKRDIRKVDTMRYLPYTDPVSVQQLPTLIQSVNLVAILHSRNDHQRERVGDAITAGPPQPAKP